MSVRSFSSFTVVVSVEKDDSRSSRSVAWYACWDIRMCVPVARIASGLSNTSW
jgi:hypothetical protein